MMRCRMGLVNRVVADDQLENAANEMARKLAALTALGREAEQTTGQHGLRANGPDRRRSLPR